MRSIERRFTNLQHKRPELSSLINFTHAVRGQKFTKRAINKWFTKLVVKDDFDRSDKRIILRHIDDLSDEPEDDNKRG
jgi:hypothetical protein